MIGLDSAVQRIKRYSNPPEADFVRWLRIPLLILIVCLGAITPLRAVERQILHGHIPSAVAQLVATGSPPATNELQLAIGLPLRNRAALTNLLDQIYDPAHPNYRHFLNPQQFTEQFGPTKTQYELVTGFLKTNGLTIVGSHANRLLVDTRGSVTAIQRAFHINLRLYPHPQENRSFYAPDKEPSVAADIPILDITGLNNFARPHPKSLRKVPSSGEGGHAPKGGSGPGGNYLGADFRAAYVPGVSLMGTGQTLGLLEFDGYYPNDIATYLSKAGLASVPLQNVLLDGFDGTPTPAPNSANNEVALDIEVAIAMAPGLSKIVVYEAGPDGYANDIISRMASDNLAAQLSCSWDFGADANAATEQIFLQFAAQGQSFFNASGDSGAYLGSVPSPDDDPYITLVGGTTLSTTGPAGSWVSETAWNAGGGTATSGGFSSAYPLPSWQTGISMTANRGSTVMRDLPDVSMVADNISIVADNGQQYPIYGTSASAPLWASFTALVNQYAAARGYPRVGFVNPAVYSLGKGASYSTYFHDIIGGNNTNSTTANRFFAVSGYDLCTGWGSPRGQQLIQALAQPDSLGIDPFAGFNANGPVGGPFNISSVGFSLTNSTSASLDWSLSNDSAWLSASPTSGTLVPAQIGTVTAALNAAAASLPVGTYTANLAFTNLTTHVTQTRKIVLTVGTSRVLNGDFESGDFSYWTLSGPSAATFNSVDNGSAVPPHSGNYGAIFGELGSLGTLAQFLPTQAGQTYLLSFWLTSVPDSSNATTPNEFRAKFEGRTLFDALNIGILDWTNAQFLVTAGSSGSLLEFGFRDDPYFLGLDDVTLIPVPTPNFLSVSQRNGAIQFTWSSLAGLSYQLQFKLSLADSNWFNLGTPVKATTGRTSASDTLMPAPGRFYRVALHP